MESKKKTLSSELNNVHSPFTCRVEELIKEDIITISANDSIHQAAEKMEKEQVGSLVVMRGKKVVGIITKGDMVTRALAKGKSPATFVKDVMSQNIITIAKGRMLFDGMLLMVKHSIGHLLVTQEGSPVGMVSERDWLVHQERHLASSIWEIEETESLQELAVLKERANTLVWEELGEGSTTENVTERVTEINDRISRRIIELTLRDTDTAPPVHFAWISLGSEGRKEQILSTDQDNGIVFADVSPERLEVTSGWFLRFAERVVSGMEKCGYPRCVGNIMASNPNMCLSLSDWKRELEDLMGSTEPDNILKGHIYFDFRCLYGEQSLVDAIWKDLSLLLVENREFLNAIAFNEKLFGLVPVNDIDWKMRSIFGMLPPPINLKKWAISPLVRCLRVLALVCGSSETNSMKRLEVIRQHGLLPSGLAEDIQDAYNFLIMLRMRQHLKQHTQDEELHNQIDFKHLKRMEARFLIDALKTVRELQAFVMKRFRGLAVG